MRYLWILVVQVYCSDTCVNSCRLSRFLGKYFIDIGKDTNHQRSSRIVRYSQILLIKIISQIHHFALPYHTAAFELNKALLLISSTANDTSSREAEELKFNFVTAVYDNQDVISNSALANVASKDIPKIIFDNYVAKVNPKLSEQIYNTAMSGRQLWDEARQTFKYATTRAVFGTPTFFVNGVQIYNGGSYGSQDWVALFTQLLK
jgi:hypothetical protein